MYTGRVAFTNDGIKYLDVQKKKDRKKDIVEVVRCMYCKYGTEIEDGSEDDSGIECEFDAYRHHPEWFCADGKRKDNG